MGPAIQQLFLQLVVPAAFTVLAALITFGGKKLINLIDTKTKNEAVAGILSRLTSTVATVVLDINGTLKAAWVRAAADGVITPAEKLELRREAIRRIKEHLGAKGLAELTAILGIHSDLIDGFIGSHVEAAIEGSKQAPDTVTKLAGTLPSILATVLAPKAPAPVIDPTVSSTGDAVPPVDPK